MSDLLSADQIDAARAAVVAPSGNHSRDAALAGEGVRDAWREGFCAAWHEINGWGEPPTELLDAAWQRWLTNR